ncbi:uncharacterized protein MELLADRAFT_106045 [Melampsora larici-populina 98AG31]|uniref:Uncharacterized protein n=1 Tax=Melampsora larici-populina (strain 98AG31 / pathotype 3-4-7) TaxID=747676 RepID=F4RK68_MELLP|nr:uncharacterized protein MELLADRAFT_106045 [Melampsora larici-populina 98AG31]EGG07046.1 hypothetical protein MELLADRAFT_106045 [Melampsora larici-populina 98AG31]
MLALMGCQQHRSSVPCLQPASFFVVYLIINLSKESVDSRIKFAVSIFRIDLFDHMEGIGIDGVLRTSSYTYQLMGPQVWMLLFDFRSERKKDRLCRTSSYKVVFNACRALPSSVTQWIISLGIPYDRSPRMVFAERFLQKKSNPVLAAANVLAAPNVCGLLLTFLAGCQLSDPNIHFILSSSPPHLIHVVLYLLSSLGWAQSHKPERHWLVTECQKLAVDRKFRIDFVRGDVHCFPNAQRTSVIVNVSPSFVLIDGSLVTISRMSANNNDDATND